jgi:hypothetical protein
MVKAKAKTKFDGKKVMAAAKRANITNLGHAGAAIRLQARHSIRKAKGPSAPGTPPHTRKGRIRNAIKYALTPGKQSVVIGPDAEVAADSGSAHEFGGRYRQENYDKRPFMGPALEKTKDRLPRMWAGSVKG